MALQIPGVVKRPDNVDHLFAAPAIDQNMPRLFTIPNSLLARLRLKKR
jgi:hypothetical protein